MSEPQKGSQSPGAGRVSRTFPSSTWVSEVMPHPSSALRSQASELVKGNQIADSGREQKQNNEEPGL